MTPREVLEKAFERSDYIYLSGPSAGLAVDEIMRRLKAEGLFIGPLVATPEMLAVEDIEYTMPLGEPRVSTDPAQLAGSWNAMVEAWRRGEGE